MNPAPRQRPPATFVARAKPSRLFSVLSFLGPLLGSAAHTQSDPLFRSDAAVLYALESAPALGGSVSRALGQFALQLPLGNLPFRLALVGALGAGLLGLCAFYFTFALFRAQGGHSRLDPWLAWGASLAAALNLPAASEATVAGGAVLGPALGLFALRKVIRGFSLRFTSDIALLGALLGAVFAESLYCGLLMVLSALIFGETKVRNLRATWVRWSSVLGIALGVSLLFWLPTLTRLNPDQLPVSRIETFFPPWSPLSWMSSVGLLWCAGAAFALFFGPRDRRILVVIISVVALDWLVPASAGPSWTDSHQVDAQRSALHLFALANVACLGALGMRAVAEGARALELFGARQLSLMVSMIAVAGSVAGAEDALRTLSQTNTKGAQAWTDEAIGSLPPHSLVLTHESVLGTRLLAAQALGYRQDLLIVPFSELLDTHRVRSWLKKEPSLDLLLRDLSLSEHPSERAIAKLVDTRPVYIEPNENWDRRLLEHVEPGFVLSRLSTHALGRSDRIAALDASSPSQTRIVTQCAEGLKSDPMTAAFFESGLDRLAKILGSIDQGALRHLEGLRHPGPPSDEEDEAASGLAAL